MEYLLLNKKLYFNKLKWEIKAIQTLTDMILPEVENNMKNDVTEVKARNVCKNSHYDDEKIVEELYSNLSNFLLLVGEYLKQRGNLQDHFTLPVIVKSPKAFSLAALCSLLWKRVESLNFSKPKTDVFTEKGDGQIEISNKGVQTDISCLTYCASCCLCTDLVKSLVSVILSEQEKYGLKITNVSEFKQNMNKKVLDLSQWGAMQGWTKAILKDMQWASTTISYAYKQLAESHIKIKTTKQEHDKVILTLKNNLNSANVQLEAELAQCAYLKQQIDDLNGSLSRREKREQMLLKEIRKYKDKLSFLNESMKFLIDDCKHLRKVQNSLRTLMKVGLSSNSRNISDIKSELNVLAENVQGSFEATLQRLNDNNIKMQKRLEDRENLIFKLNTNISHINEENKQCNERIDLLVCEKQQSESELGKLQKLITELENNLEESKAREELNKSHNISAREPEIKFSGDPLTDMESQRQMNKQRMRILLKENAKLKNTIQKLKEIRNN